MTNHYTTVCTIVGPEASINSFKQKHIVWLCGERDNENEKVLCFDFNTVDPMPEGGSDTVSGCKADLGFWTLTGLYPERFPVFSGGPWLALENLGMHVHALSTQKEGLAFLKEEHPEILEEGKKTLDFFCRSNGCLSWYEWSKTHWGVKGNSYNYKKRGDAPGAFIFEFQTANGKPSPVFSKLASMYPDLEFALETCDEGGPEYSGHYYGVIQQWDKRPKSRTRRVLVYDEAQVANHEADEESNELSS